MTTDQLIVLIEETASVLRTLRDNNNEIPPAWISDMELLQSSDGDVWVPYEAYGSVVGKYLRVRSRRRLFTQNSFPVAAKIRMRADSSIPLPDIGHYPVWTIYPDGVAIPGPNIQLSFSVRFVTWRELADRWEIFAYPRNYWVDCYADETPPVSPVEEIATQGVGPRRVNLEDTPSPSTGDPDVPF